MKLLVAAAIACASCERRAPIQSCDQNLGGEYVVDGKHWMAVDLGATIELVPLFPDAPPSDGLEVAPRWIDLARSDDGIVGHVRRRYMRGSAICTAKLPARITACANDAIDIVLADPVPPLELEPCAFPRPDGSRRERWQHE